MHAADAVGDHVGQVAALAHAAVTLRRQQQQRQRQNQGTARLESYTCKTKKNGKKNLRFKRVFIVCLHLNLNVNFCILKIILYVLLPNGT
jgi:hypothetical protein